MTIKVLYDDWQLDDIAAAEVVRYRFRDEVDLEPMRSDGCMPPCRKKDLVFVIGDALSPSTLCSVKSLVKEVRHWPTNGTSLCSRVWRDFYPTVELPSVLRAIDTLSKGHKDAAAEWTCLALNRVTRRPDDDEVSDRWWKLLGLPEDASTEYYDLQSMGMEIEPGILDLQREANETGHVVELDNALAWAVNLKRPGPAMFIDRPEGTNIGLAYHVECHEILCTLYSFTGELVDVGAIARRRGGHGTKRVAEYWVQHRFMGF